MIYQDRKKELDNNIALADYLASFWNPEAVNKVKDSRERAGLHNFKGDREFEEHILSGEYKENPLLKAIKKIRKMDEKKRVISSEREDSPKSKLPTDLSSIHSTLKKFK